MVPFCRDREGELIVGIRRFSVIAVKAALDIPVDPNTRSAARATPLEIAAGLGYLQIVRGLVVAGTESVCL